MFQLNYERTGIIALLLWLTLSSSITAQKNFETQKETYKPSDTIRLTIRGDFITSGSCGDEIIYGIVKQTELRWDTLVNVRNRAIMMCGFGHKKFKKESFDLVVQGNNTAYYANRFYRFEPGTYKIIFLRSKSKKVVSSNKFLITN